MQTGQVDGCLPPVSDQTHTVTSSGSVQGASACNRLPRPHSALMRAATVKDKAGGAMRGGDPVPDQADAQAAPSATSHPSDKAADRYLMVGQGYLLSPSRNLGCMAIYGAEDR